VQLLECVCGPSVCDRLCPRVSIVCLEPAAVVVLTKLAQAGSLEARLRSASGVVTWSDVFKWTLGIAAGLHHIHCEASCIVILQHATCCWALQRPFAFRLWPALNGLAHWEEQTGALEKWLAPESMASNQVSTLHRSRLC